MRSQPTVQKIVNYKFGDYNSFVVEGFAWTEYWGFLCNTIYNAHKVDYQQISYSLICFVFFSLLILFYQTDNVCSTYAAFHFILEFQVQNCIECKLVVFAQEQSRFLSPLTSWTGGGEVCKFIRYPEYAVTNK